MTSPSTDAVIEQIISGTVEDQARRAPGLRQLHAKSHGCVWGEFIVEPDLPVALQYGVLKEPKTYPIWARFSNGSSPLVGGALNPDAAPDARGISIKLLQVEGAKILEDEVSTQDFIANNYPVFFARTAENYSKVLAALSGQIPPTEIAYELGILQQVIAKKTSNPLHIQYWSMSAFRLGPQAIKYSVKPQILETPPETLPERENYLREAMVQELTVEGKDVYFDFLVQLQPSPDPMLVEDSTLEWDETISPYIKVATIKISAQEFDTPERKQFDEGLSYNPWHTLPDHEPLGSINASRLKLYQTIAKARREFNHQMPTGDPQPYSAS